jgi:hypothetical protein
MQPSSPKRPCSALKTASGRAALSALMVAGRSCVTSMGKTAKPVSRSAAITCAPVERLTSRSAEMPP